jgi:hypothetical protein
MIKLTLLNKYNYTQSFTLDGIEFKLNFKYNSRESQYYLSLLSSDNTILLSGVKIVKDTLLTGRFRKEGFPVGDFIAMSPYIFDKIGEVDFSDTLELFYITSADIEELASA